MAEEPAPRSPKEKAFVATEGWRDAVIRGRILRPHANGFVLATDEGEQGFYPAKIGAGGKIEPDQSMKDVVAPFISDLACCRPSQGGLYQCVALQAGGKETSIPEIPIVAKQGQPT